MSRWLALLISIVGGAIVGWFLFLGFAGALLGFAWLYVFGDNEWPAWSDYVLGAALVIGGFGIWLFCSRIIWLELRKRL